MCEKSKISCYRLRSEYDLKSLTIRSSARTKKLWKTTIRLEPDVAEVFPNADAVNEALKILVRVVQDNQVSAFTKQPYSSSKGADKIS